MPTDFPASPYPARRLSLPDTVRFFILLAKSHWLHRRLDAAHRRVGRFGTDVAGDGLLLAAERWLACHEEIADLLGQPVPSQVARVRAALTPVS